METFIEPKELKDNPHYQIQRSNALSYLTDEMIESPIIEIIHGLNKLPHCFTLQSCYGHFVYEGNNNINNLDTLPTDNIISKVEYRIAYIAFCIENSSSGRDLIDSFKDIAYIDPENVQFCSARWFWEKQVNSYALQVEPDRFKHQDKAIIDYEEALNIEKIRDEFFIQLKERL